MHAITSKTQLRATDIINNYTEEICTPRAVYSHSTHTSSNSV